MNECSLNTIECSLTEHRNNKNERIINIKT